MGDIERAGRPIDRRIQLQELLRAKAANSGFERAAGAMAGLEFLVVQSPRSNLAELGPGILVRICRSNFIAFPNAEEVLRGVRGGCAANENIDVHEVSIREAEVAVVYVAAADDHLRSIDDEQLIVQALADLSWLA
jgi:hypothetical protein